MDPIQATTRTTNDAAGTRPPDLSDAEWSRRSDLCAALQLKATEMLELAEASGYALLVGITVYDGPVKFIFH